MKERSVWISLSKNGEVKVMIEIWQPKWKDRTVLISTMKVVEGENRIIFTKTPAYKGQVFKCDGSLIRNCPVVSNGKIDCFAVPLSKLERVG